MRRLLLISFLGLFFLGITPLPVEAASEFETIYSTSYHVDLSGVTTVTQDIALTNKLSNVYADRFSLSVGFTDVENVKVKDAVGLIDPEIVKTDNQTTIRFQFIDKVVGKEKVNNFSVSYQTRDIAVKNGSVWEINIPQLETDKGISDQEVALVVPSSFGLPAFITPEPNSSTKNPAAVGTTNSYVFKATTLGSKAISTVFGTTQHMKFNLIYHLENNSPVGQKTEIALPPDTNYQKMIYESIQPPPENVLLDEDGNWIAQYSLGPGERITVNTVGVVRLWFVPGQSKPPENGAYLGSGEFWQVNNPQIQSLGNQLQTPEAIYDYITDYLSYDYNKLQIGNQRAGAVAALAQPLAAICTEFTDLYVAVSRAANIPARELEGYAFTSNDKLRPLSLTKDVLHAWPEYYDYQTQRWIQVDPTWGNTTGGVDYFEKLDLNHFVFVIHGQDSVRPLPAGAYKTSQPTKDVKVIASDPVILPTESIGFVAKAKRRLWKGEIELSVINEGMVSAEPDLSWKSEPIGIINGGRKLETIPPFGRRVIIIDLSKGMGLVTTPKYLVIQNNGQEIRIPIETTSAANTPLKVAAGTIVAIVLAAGAYLTYRLFVRRRKGNTSLYR